MLTHKWLAILRLVLGGRLINGTVLERLYEGWKSLGVWTMRGFRALLQVCNSCCLGEKNTFQPDL